MEDIVVITTDPDGEENLASAKNSLFLPEKSDAAHTAEPLQRSKRGVELTLAEQRLCDRATD